MYIVVKRDGKETEFDLSKISVAISKAFIALSTDARASPTAYICLSLVSTGALRRFFNSNFSSTSAIRASTFLPVFASITISAVLGYAKISPLFATLICFLWLIF